MQCYKAVIILNTVSLIAAKIVLECFNKTGSKLDNKNVNSKLMFCFVRVLYNVPF